MKVRKGLPKMLDRQTAKDWPNGWLREEIYLFEISVTDKKSYDDVAAQL